MVFEIVHEEGGAVPTVEASTRKWKAPEVVSERNRAFPEVSMM